MHGCIAKLTGLLVYYQYSYTQFVIPFEPTCFPTPMNFSFQVPFGKFAFMPGQLYHTNEVLVLLGDNWFVKRSTKQALEITERRKKCTFSLLFEVLYISCLYWWTCLRPQTKSNN